MIKLLSMLSPILLASVVLMGCASHTQRSIPQLDSSKMRFSAAESGLIVRVEPYDEAARQQEVFDKVLTEYNYLPIRLLLENGSGEVIYGRPYKFDLVMPNGESLRPARPAKVAQELFDSGGVMASTFLLGGIGMLASGSAEADAKEARSLDYETKALGHVRLGSGQSEGGFLYFSLPATVPGQIKATLRVRLIRAKDSSIVLIGVPIEFAWKGES